MGDSPDELLPWSYSNPKLDEDAQKLETYDDPTTISKCITGRKSWFTKAVNMVTNDKKYASSTNVQGKQSLDRYEKTLDFLENRMGMLVNAYRRILALQDERHQQQRYAEFDILLASYQTSRDVIDALIDAASPATPDVARPPPENAERDSSVQKCVSDLKPQLLTETTKAHLVFDFAEKLKVYFSAAGIIKRPLTEQHQYLRSFLSSQLWALIRDRINPEMPIFMDRTQQGYIRGEINSCIELLLEEFKMLIQSILFSVSYKLFDFVVGVVESAFRKVASVWDRIFTSV